MQYTFSSELRNEVGTNASHRSRENGYVPAIIYGRDMNSLPLEINSNEVENFIRNYGNGGLIGLNIGGVDYTVFIKEVQKDPITSKIIHVDFQQVSQNERINITIPIVLKGKALVERSGSIVQQQLRDLEIECLAGSIPQSLEVDISSFRPGDTIKVADMEFGQEISIIHDPESVVASVAFIKDRIEEDESEEE